MSTMDLIKDENYFGEVSLFNEQRKIVFEKIALIPYDGVLYTILCPKELLEKGEENCAMIFALVDGENGEDLAEINDEEIISQIFELYYELESELENEDF